MYFMRLLQWGLGMLRYFRSLAQPAVDVIGKFPFFMLVRLLHTLLTLDGFKHAHIMLAILQVHHLRHYRAWVFCSAPSCLA